MTLKKLSSKSIFTVFKTQLYQMRMILVLFGLIVLVFPTLLTLGEFTNRQWEQYTYVMTVKDYVRQFIAIGGFTPMFGLGMAMAVAQFGYLHRKRNLDYFHALPVLRAEHFTGRVLAALAALIGAACVVGLGQTFAIGVTLGFGETANLGDPQMLSYIWEYCKLIVIPAFGVYIFTALIVILTATMWEAVFSLVAVSAFGPAVFLFMNALITSSIPVYSTIENEHIMLFLSPLTYAVYYVIELTNVTLWLNFNLPLLIELLQILVCGVMAAWFFCRRKSELAETGGATRFKIVVRFAAAFCAVVFFSLAFLWVSDSYIVYLIGSVVGLVIAWLILELMYTRSVRRAMKCLVPNLLGYAVFVVINVLVALGIVGVPQIPNLEDVNAVSVLYSKEEYMEEYSSYDRFHGNTEMVYTDMDMRRVSMGTFDAELVRDGHELAQEILDYQKVRYFPYLPRQLGDAYLYGMREIPDDERNLYYDLNVQLYTEGKIVRIDYRNYGNDGELGRMFESAKAIAAAPEYKLSNPSLALMENLDYVQYMNYEEHIDSEQYSASEIADREDFIRRLQEAYLEDMYSVNTDIYDDNVEEYHKGLVYSETTVADTAVPVSISDEYSLYVDVSKSVTLKGGIIDDFYPAEGMVCWLVPEFTPAYEETNTDAENTMRSDCCMYFYRSDFPKTCAVLDELRMTAE